MVSLFIYITKKIKVVIEHTYIQLLTATNGDLAFKEEDTSFKFFLFFLNKCLKRIDG